MYKKLTIILMIISSVLVSSPGLSFAYSIHSKSDPSGVITSEPFYFAGKDEIRISYKSGTVRSTQWSFVETGTGRTFEKTLSAPTGNYYTASGFTCVGTYDVKIMGDSGGTLASLSLEVHASDLNSPKCESDASGEISDKCDACALLSCPGWGDFMGKLDDIKAAIPPPPNWPVVADVFRDSIAPQIKADMADLIGTIPEPVLPTLPKPPNLPTAPPMLEDVKTDIEVPTGQEAPGLEESTFNEDDIKNSAPIIQEREDPTGGFKIVNPIDSLPSQEEFIKNKPNEGDAPLPGNPKELENISPTPEEPINTAPTPGDTGDTAPIPGDAGNVAPLPGTDTSTAPIPGVGNDKAPIPGGGGIYSAPTP